MSSRYGRGWPERGWYPPSRPLPADGIKARSKRGAIGEQWWSRRFIDVLESLGMSGRLQRGRRYARAGQVLELQVSPGDVDARVQGSRPVPYKVRIRVLPLTTPQWRRVEETLAGQALFRARLLAGEMPAEIEDVFAECGTPLFPGSLRDLEMRCSCPDYQVPCKHLAAVCYVLAERFDDDPFAMLAWRGRDREALLAAVRRTAAPGQGGRTGRAGQDGPEGPGLVPGVPEALLGVAAPQLADCLADPAEFWSPGMSAARLAALPAAPAAAPDLLLRMFEPPGVLVRGKDLATVLAPAYQRFAAAGELLGEDIADA